MVPDEWDDALAEDAEDDDKTTTAAGTDNAETQQPQPKYPTVEAWVTAYLAPLVTQELTRNDCWCPQWWQHPEGILRLEALWRTWEHLRLDGTTGMSVWLRDHRDTHVPFLLDRSVSPFANCTADGGHKDGPPPLPVEPAPPGWWNDDKGSNPGEPATTAV